MSLKGSDRVQRDSASDPFWGDNVFIWGNEKCSIWESHLMPWVQFRQLAFELQVLKYGWVITDIFYGLFWVIFFCLAKLKGRAFSLVAAASQGPEACR